MNHQINIPIKCLVLDLQDGPGPDFLTTRGIQKGLAANYLGKCLVGEGLSFGAPVVTTPTTTFFKERID